MTQLAALRLATGRTEIASLLGFKLSALAFILYQRQEADRYICFEIPKRYGGVRQISAPREDLKLLQRRLSELLQNCVGEINETNDWDHRASHGFEKHRSIITNAREHRNRRYVFNVDLKDFFGSINFGRVRGFFLKDKNFLLHEAVATLLAQIACYKNGLPQGSPCSPVIANLIGHVLDLHLVRLAARNGCTYSRYADDLTFSTNKQEFPSSIAKRDLIEPHTWRPGNELAGLTTKNGFEINPLKTRMQYHDSRQEVTGLVVNKKVNIRYEYRHTVRAMVHNLLTKGKFEFVQRVTDAAGSTSLTREEGRPNQLHGMLGFIDSVDMYNSAINKTLRNQTGSKEETSKESIYRRFLLFKEFYAASSPVVICEGKTDNIYLVHAIRSLVAKHPELATLNADGTIKLGLRIFKYSDASTGRILEMNGGTGDLAKFTRSYHRESKKFKAPGAQKPVILLVDNDTGPRGKGNIFSTVEQITGKKVLGSETFIHIFSNLYLVATPLVGGATASMIEDFFDAPTKATKILGKTFDVTGKLDTATHYSKVVFAHKVIAANAAKIDFSAFDVILDTLTSVLDEHAKKHPATP